MTFPNPSSTRPSPTKEGSHLSAAADSIFLNGDSRYSITHALLPCNFLPRIKSQALCSLPLKEGGFVALTEMILYDSQGKAIKILQIFIGGLCHHVSFPETSMLWKILKQLMKRARGGRPELTRIEWHIPPPSSLIAIAWVIHIRNTLLGPFPAPYWQKLWDIFKWLLF